MSEQGSGIPPVPPELPPPPPPLLDPPSQPRGNPWERRDELGAGQGLIETIRLFIVSPVEAFAMTRERGDMASPVLFALILGWAGIVLNTLWEMLFTPSLLTRLPPELQEQIAPYLGGGRIQQLAMLLIAPVLVLIGLFVVSAILHLCLMVLGGLGHSRSGFEGTLRAVSYAAVAQLAHALPVVGQLLAAAWGLVLIVLGLTRLHRVGTGRAIAAILLPLLLCCACCAVVVVFVVIGVGSLAGR